MARTAWTDERLDDLSRHLDTRFDGVDRRFEHVDRRFDRVDDAIADVRQTFLRVGGGVIVGLIGVIAAVISTG